MTFQIPPKKYILILVMAAYLIAKCYVLLTPSPDDDQVPDKIRDKVLQVLP